MSGGLDWLDVTFFAGLVVLASWFYLLYAALRAELRRLRLLMRAHGWKAPR